MATEYTPNWDKFDTPIGERLSLLAASEGEAGTGKTHFWMTAPGPIWVAAFDAWGTRRIDPAILKGKDIRIARYPFDPTSFKTQADMQRAATILWNTFIADYLLALKKARTIIWDREDMVYKVQRYSLLGGTKAAPKEYEDLYTEYVGLIQAANQAGVNLGLLRGYKDKWISKFDTQKQKMVGHNTGDRVPEGMGKVPDHVDITLHHRWDDASRSYMVRLGKFTNKEERGKEYPDLTFTDMALLAYPETTLEDWE